MKRLLIVLDAVGDRRPAPAYASAQLRWRDALSLGACKIELGTGRTDIIAEGRREAVPNGGIIVCEDQTLMKVAPAFYPDLHQPLWFNLRTGKVAQDLRPGRFSIVTRWVIRLIDSDPQAAPLFEFSAPGGQP